MTDYEKQMAEIEDEVAEKMLDALEYALEQGWTITEIRDEVEQFCEQAIEGGELR